MTTTLASLTTPLTVEECKAAIYAAIEARGASTSAWTPGSVVRTIIAGLAIVLSAFSTLQADIAKSGFLALSEGDWLTLVARYVYGVERDLGSFAAGTVTLSNAAGGVYSGGVGDLVVIDTATSKTYRSTEAYSLAALGTTTVAVEAVEIGTESNAAPGAIDGFVTTLNGVTVSNAAALVGADVETDAALRLRCAEKTGSLSPNGPSDAYAYVARSATQTDGVTSIGVTRVRTVPDGLGNVAVYLATATGGVTGTVGDLATDLGAIDDAIQAQVVPLGVTATVASAVAKLIPVTYELWIRDTTGYSDATIKSLVVDALTAFMAAQPIGGFILTAAPGYVYTSALVAVIGSAIPGAEVRVLVTAPAADVVIAADEAPVLSTPTGTVHQVAGGTL